MADCQPLPEPLSRPPGFAFLKCRAREAVAAYGPAVAGLAAAESAEAVHAALALAAAMSRLAAQLERLAIDEAVCEAEKYLAAQRAFEAGVAAGQDRRRGRRGGLRAVAPSGP